MRYAGVMFMEEDFATNRWLPFAAAIGFHLFLLMWDPTILKAGAYHAATEVINVKIMDHLPVLTPEPPKKVERIIEKKQPKKANKSGLSLSAKSDPVTAMHRRPTAKALSSTKRFISKLTMPKFVPHETDEPIAASPLPGVVAASSRRAISPMTPPPAFRGKTRGVRVQDIPFHLSDRGSAVSGAGVVAIPIGEETASVASLPSMPILQGTPKGRKGISGYRFAPGNGTGSGELTSRDRSGHIGYHGMVKADTYIEGTLSEGNGNGKGGKVVSGKGFDIGGPVGDRKILHRLLPKYPAWAEEQGISAQVKIYFTVKSDGSIRSTMRILTSSGYAELDDLAKQALHEWRFSPTSASSTEETSWGVITFRFTLAS